MQMWMPAIGINVGKMLCVEGRRGGRCLVDVEVVFFLWLEALTANINEKDHQSAVTANKIIGGHDPSPPWSLCLWCMLSTTCWFSHHFWCICASIYENVSTVRLSGLLLGRWCRYFFRTRYSSIHMSFLVKTDATAHAMSTKSSQSQCFYSFL